MKNVLIIMSLLLAGTQAGYAFDLQKVHDDVAQEFATCTAYYRYVSNSPKLRGETKQAYLEAAESLHSLAVKLTNAESTDKRIDAQTKILMTELGGDWKNFRKLLEKYGYSCKQMAEHPTETIVKFVEIEKRRSDQKK